ncbi:aldo/keto reductase [Phenylobacterium deserti]|uniref:Aldo/keto reductase n=1 Tax=Phenylobacterium deserti TaxID=1914756 RepID=A0A328ATG3_9CAUL|nr:aldo/keto reductase [Phenylobacterium deserti]RAK56784.1 aldo/keto reductase [Phenylobacterium deserti]
MQYVRLGNTGLKVSRLVLGCMTYGSPSWRPWVLEEDEARAFFQKAIEGGINVFDTANMYSLGRSEEITGRLLREFARRDEVVIATKVFFPMGDGANEKGLSRKHIMSQVDASLRRLGVDHIDLYQIHRFDYETPIEETMEALHDVVKAGKARYLGASSMYAWQFAKMQAVTERHGWTKFVSMQPQYNLVYREEEREMLPFCRSEGVGVIPWSPLARGFLAGGRAAPKQGETKRAQTDELAPKLYFRDADQQVVQAVSDVAEARGLSNTQVALAWVLRNPAITAPIIGASKLHHLEQALAALDVVLSDDEAAKLEAPYQPKPVLDHA